MKAFVFTSSIAAFGTSDGKPPFTESSPKRPEDPYGIAKMAFEQDLQAAYHMFGLHYIIFRPHNVYGPRQNIADKFRNAIGIFMNQILRNENITVFGNGDQTRAFSYISDVSTIIGSSLRPSLLILSSLSHSLTHSLQYKVQVSCFILRHTITIFSLVVILSTV